MRRARVSATATATATILLASCAALGVRGSSPCYTDGSDFGVQASAGGTWECCADHEVKGIDFEVTVLSSSNDPMEWGVYEYGDSIGYSDTKCDITWASSSPSCTGATCVAANVANCGTIWTASREQRLCLKGKCNLASGTSNTHCSATIRMQFSDKPTESGPPELNQGETAGVASAVVFVVVGISHFVRIMRLRRQGFNVNFFSSASIRKRTNLPQPQPVPQPPPPQVQPQMHPTAPSSVVIPGQAGGRDTVVVFQGQQPQQPRRFAPAPQAPPSAAESYYPSV